MIQTNIGPDERRLRVLESLQILDTLPEEGFDDLVYLASSLCQTPISAVSLIDRDRQWFKAILGLSVAETSRDLSFCSHAIKIPNDLMVVEDATQDPRFAENLLVTGPPSIRFYAGVPLVVDGEAIGALCIIDHRPRELTPDQRETMRRLGRQVVAQLELRRNVDLLERRSVELALARDEARASARAKAALLANLSHEIRTPMNGIVGVSSLLLRTDINERQRQYVEMVRGSGEALMKVLEDVLDYSQRGIQNEATGFTHVNVGEIVDEVVSMLRPAAVVKELLLLSQIQGLNKRAEIDAPRFRQMMVHLISAAVRIAPDGVVSVSAHSSQSLFADEVLISIKVSPQSIAWQTDGQFNIEELLTDAAEMIRPTSLALQANLKVERRADTSVSIEITVPLLAAAKEGCVGEPVVLVAEDNDVNSLVLASMLESQGCRVICVADGQEAVEAATTRTFDMVFMDLQMPVLDGFSAAREIRRRETVRRTPIVAVTASAVQGQSSALLDSGLDELLMKPLTDRAVSSSLRRWLPNLF